MLKRQVYVLTLVLVAAIAGRFYLAMHKSVPYFAEIPFERFKSWKPAPFLPAGEGNTWKLGQYTQGTSAMSHDVEHYVLQRDGKIYDLVNSDDTWGFGDAPSWRIDLIGDHLYVFDAHEDWEPGWFHITTQKYDWLLPRLGLEPDGKILRIAPPTGLSVPTSSQPGSLFRVESGHLQLVRAERDYDDLFEHLETGDYYLSTPGLGVRRVFDLTRAPMGK